MNKKKLSQRAKIKSYVKVKENGWKMHVFIHRQKSCEFVGVTLLKY